LPLRKIADSAFPTLGALPALTLLDITGCVQETITNTAFLTLSQSRTLAEHPALQPNDHHAGGV
jgi:hypothetical protein